MDNYKDIDRKELSIVAKKRIARELEQETQRKIRTDAMLEAIPDDHEHADELRKLVNDEWHVGMLEMNSGNGRFATEWNPERLHYANANDSQEHFKSGLAEELVDHEQDCNIESLNPSELVDHSHTVEVPVLLGHTLDGKPIESKTQTELVSYSPYSIWDTIASKGALIVRKSKQWQGGFRSDKWTKFDQMRMKRIHNKAMGKQETIAQGDKRLTTAEQRKAKRLAKMQARRGGLAKVGYNAFS
jgi:hypothetical protein